MKILRSILLALIGIACIITGIKELDHDVGSMTFHEIYRGDAYTGIQNAISDVTLLVAQQNRILVYGLGYIMIFGGATLIVCAIPTNLSQKGE